MHDAMQSRSPAPPGERPDTWVVTESLAPSAAAGRGARDLLLCLSHLRWDFVWQRPQHLLSRAARDYDVVVFEEPTFKHGGEPSLDVTERPGGIKVAVPVLPHGTTREGGDAAQRVLLDRFIAARPSRRLVAWYYTPMALAFSRHLRADLVVYDNMDELSAFRGASPEMLANEADLFARADLVFTGGLSLWEAKRDRHPNVTAFPSSIDAAHFAVAREPQGPEPADLAGIPHPRLGFFGVIDERMDLDLVARTARLRPDWHFVMIGPVAKIDPDALPAGANIHWLGPKSYDELPAYLAGFDLGFMPFALNEATRFISPTKTPEYLAAGVPVLSTPITDVVRPYGDLGLVGIGRTAAEMTALAESWLARPRGEWLAEVDRHLAGQSWDLTWTAMRRAMAGAPRNQGIERPGAPGSREGLGQHV